MLHVLKYNGLEIAKNLEYASSTLSKILGLMFRKQIHPDYAMIFILDKPSRVGIHTLFMRFPIVVIFLNGDKKISGFFRLNPWTGFKGMKNIKYVIEMDAGIIERYDLSVGGQMEFEDPS